ELDSSVREIATIEAKDGGGFEDRDGDGFPEIVLADWHWAYALTCFACLDYPEVVLKFDGDRYIPSADLMRRPEPSESDQEFCDRIRTIHSIEAFDRLNYTRSEMLRRIYCGHADSAWSLFDKAYEKEWGDRAKLLDDFSEVLRSSPYFAFVES